VREGYREKFQINSANLPPPFRETTAARDPKTRNDLKMELLLPGAKPAHIHNIF
jgi:hypothetical protein